MKKKLLIGGGLVALVAVIVAIAVFGKGGDYFKGSSFPIPKVEIPEFETPSIPGKVIPKVELDLSDKVVNPSIPKIEDMKIIVPFCGDGVKQGSEECDDGNIFVNDYCNNDCEKTTPITFEPAKPLYTAVCGNGIKEIGEECDGGVDCKSDCTKKPVVPEPVEPTKPSTTTSSAAVVECGEWNDTKGDEPDFDIWVNLCEKGIVMGDGNGNLRPNDKLNRAELLAIAFRASDHENVYAINSNAKNCFPDVKTQWYASAICTGKTKGFIQGYSDGKMKPENLVTLPEGTKMFLGALDEPFDTSDKKCWYCDMVEEAGENNYLPYSFTDPKQVGSIELTREKAFNMLYRMLYYR